MLSPSTRKIDIGLKRDIYAREGVAHMWLLDPGTRSLETFELFERRWRSIAKLNGNQSVSRPSFEAISFSLAGLWGESSPQLAQRRYPQVHDEASAI